MQTKSEERGATLVEFTLVFPMLLLFSIIGVDLLRVAYQQLSLQYVLAREKRAILLGSYSDARTIRAKFDEHLRTFGLSLGPNDSLTVCPMASYRKECPEGTVVTPAADTLIALSVKRRVELFVMPQTDQLGNGTITLGAVTLGMSEPR